MKITHEHPISGLPYEIEFDRNVFSVSKGGLVVHFSTEVKALGGDDIGESTALAVAKSWVNSQDG